MAGKVRIWVYVDLDVFEAFKDYVYSKYGTLHKYLGDELSRAMAAYLRDHQDAQTQEFEHMISKPNKKHLQLLVWLLKNYPAEILYSEVKTYINDNYGFDRRTVKKYLHDFLINGGFVKANKAIRRNSDLILKVQTKRILSYLKKYVPEEQLIEKYGLQLQEEKQETKAELKTYITERYESGDSLEEIKEKVEDFGVELGKKAIRSIIRKAMRDEYV